jgi:SAM-dependent methyltransferase
MSHSTLVAKRFGARAAQYDEHALLQRQAATRLAEFIKANGGLPASGLVTEIGCGTGLLAELIAPDAERYLATDIAPEMLERCRQRLADLPHAGFAVQDGETAAFDEPPAAIVSNLAAQWFQDPVEGLRRLAGQTPFFAFAVPLAGSFPEWRQAFRDLGREPGLLPLPTHPLPDRDPLSALRQRARLCGQLPEHRRGPAPPRLPARTDPPGAGALCAGNGRHGLRALRSGAGGAEMRGRA